MGAKDSQVRRYFNEPHFGIWKELADSDLKEFFDAERTFLTNRANLRAGSFVLDVGCGSGDSIDPIVDRADVYGIDFSEAQMKRAKNRFAQNPNVHLAYADVSQLPFSGSQFDYIICMGNTFGNFEEPDKCLEEMCRVIKQKGKIILGVYSKNALEMQLRTYRAHGRVILAQDEDKVVIGGDNAVLTSRRYLMEQLTRMARLHNLEATIFEPTAISYIALFSKSPE